jgi:hypothetical protein
MTMPDPGILPGLRLVMCKVCLTSTHVNPNQDPHTVLFCRCCPEQHHHGEAASACPKTHEGSCWNPPDQPNRPDGCTVCRPILHLMLGPVTVTQVVR